MQSRKQNLEKNRRTSLAIYMVIVTVVCLYAGLHLGVVYREMDEPTLFGALAEFATHTISLFPTHCSWMAVISLWILRENWNSSWVVY